MYIRILNKNLETEDDYTSAKTYEIAEGAVFTYTKNETLDSATIVIENQTEKIEMSPYDIVEILNYAGQRFQINNTSGLMCIDTYTETMTCVNPKIYRYEITLFSETKQLEGIILPNLKITKVWNKTRTVYDYINQYMTEYCPYIRVQNGNTYSYKPKWKWDDDLHTLQNKFNMQCPEMQWNTPTLREILNDLMMVADCIPVLNDGTLSFMDLTEVGDTDWTNDTTHINYVTRSKSSEDYVSELQIKLENVTNKTEGINNVVTKVEYGHLSIPDNEVAMTTNNIVLKTRYPIYNLKSVKIMFPGSRRDSSGENVDRRWDEIDLMNLPASNGTDRFSIISEYQEWITKKIRYNSAGPYNFEDWAKFQNFSLYYTRGSNEISNLSQTGKVNWLLIFPANWVLWELLTTKIMQVNFDYGINTSPNWYNLLFAIEYETLEGCLFRASKNDDVEHERVVIDNQTNSMVDSYSQGFLEYQKANRLGNEQLQINARFDADETLIQIGDTYEDCVIYQVQHQIFKNHIEVNALATKNYILREYFTGVKSKIRSWAIASGSEALTRHDLLKYYCEFSYNEHNEAHGLAELSTNNISKYLLSPLTVYTAEPLKVCFVRTVDSDGNIYPPDTISEVKSYYTLDLMSRIIGNSLVFTFEFLDNYWAGQSFHTENDFNDGSTPEEDDKYIKYNDIKVVNNALGIDTSVLIGSPGGVPMYQHRYTDDNGEFMQGQIIFGYGLHNAIGYEDVQPNDFWWLNNNTLAASKAFVYAIYQRPRVYEYNIKYNDDYNYEVFKTTFDFSKDSQEITNISTQLEFSTETNNICFSKEFLKRQKAVATTAPTSLSVRIYNQGAYNFRKPDILPDNDYVYGNYAVTINLSNENNSNLNERITLRIGPGSSSPATIAQFFYPIVRDKKSIYIVDQSNTVVMAINNIPEVNFTIIRDDDLYYPEIHFFMNILRTRNKNIYDENNHYLIVDKI